MLLLRFEEMGGELAFALEVEGSLVGAVENVLYFLDSFWVFVRNDKHDPLKDIFGSSRFLAHRNLLLFGDCLLCIFFLLGVLNYCLFGWLWSFESSNSMS